MLRITPAHPRMQHALNITTPAVLTAAGRTCSARNAALKTQHTTARQSNTMAVQPYMTHKRHTSMSLVLLYITTAVLQDSCCSAQLSHPNTHKLKTQTATSCALTGIAV
jgi:hypothetical protein